MITFESMDGSNHKDSTGLSLSAWRVARSLSFFLLKTAQLSKQQNCFGMFWASLNIGRWQRCDKGREIWNLWPRTRDRSDGRTSGDHRRTSKYLEVLRWRIEVTGDHRRESLRALRPGLVLQLLRLDVLLQNENVGTQNSSHELQHELHGHPSHLIWYFLISKYFLICITIARDMSNLCLGFLFSIEWCFSGLHRNPQDSWYAWYDSLRILEFLILQGCFIIVFHQSCLCPMDSV